MTQKLPLQKSEFGDNYIIILSHQYVKMELENQAKEEKYKRYKEKKFLQINKKKWNEEAKERGQGMKNPLWLIATIRWTIIAKYEVKLYKRFEQGLN